MDDLTLGTTTAGDPFAVPAAIATQTLGILGQRGSGKSNTEVVLAEGFYDAGVPWVAVDPKGDWWGIRSSSDGSAAGLPVPILGGLHGDVELSAGEGAQWADLLFTENLTAVLDVSDFSKTQRAQFLVGFFDRLYRLHRQDPQVRHVFMEEAHEYIPQQVGREEGRLKEAAARLVLQGRSFGLGCSACSQRSARLHKDVLTQIGILVAHRTTGPQDRKAIEAWVVEHEMGRELVASLPELADGEAWWWSPEFMGLLSRVQFRQRRTFDSGATPTIGSRPRQLATLADVDLAAIKEQMAESLERARRDDPRFLREQLARAEARVRELEMWEPPPPPAPVIISVPQPVLAARDSLVEAMAEAARRMQRLCEAVDAAQRPDDEPTRPRPDPTAGMRAAAAIREARSSLPPLRREKPAARPPVRDGDGWEPHPGTAPAKVLAVLARVAPAPMTQSRCGFLAGIPSRKSTLRNAISELRSHGLVEGPGSELAATPQGVAAANLAEMPSGPELLAYWRGKLSGANRSVFEVLLAAGGADVPLHELHEATGIPEGVSTMRNALSSLRAHGLVVDRGRALDPDFVESIR